MAITFTGLAQQMPYNPDANGDEFVGVDDVLVHHHTLPWRPRARENPSSLALQGVGARAREGERERMETLSTREYSSSTPGRL